MVKTCCVYSCRNRANPSAKSKNISFFRFPANKRKLQAWIKAVNRKDWEPNAHSHVCSEHFVSGWHSDDPNDANYAPTLFSRRERKRQKKAKTVEESLETFIQVTYKDEFGIFVNVWLLSNATVKLYCTPF